MGLLRAAHHQREHHLAPREAVRDRRQRPLSREVDTNHPESLAHERGNWGQRAARRGCAREHNHRPLGRVLLAVHSEVLHDVAAVEHFLQQRVPEPRSVLALGARGRPPPNASAQAQARPEQSQNQQRHRHRDGSFRRPEELLRRHGAPRKQRSHAAGSHGQEKSDGHDWSNHRPKHRHGVNARGRGALGRPEPVAGLQAVRGLLRQAAERPDSGRRRPCRRRRRPAVKAVRLAEQGAALCGSAGWRPLGKRSIFVQSAASSAAGGRAAEHGPARLPRRLDGQQQGGSTQARPCRRASHSFACVQ
mmetsp:Transcript_3064/g.12636  ORF Transcript_3064/g.12636 Transcript_3064/m.12636 type:complete len:305 (-) Transcript_3064:783-1697(-)